MPRTCASHPRGACEPLPPLGPGAGSAQTFGKYLSGIKSRFGGRWVSDSQRHFGPLPRFPQSTAHTDQPGLGLPLGSQTGKEGARRGGAGQGGLGSTGARAAGEPFRKEGMKRAWCLCWRCCQRTGAQPLGGEGRCSARGGLWRDRVRQVLDAGGHSELTDTMECSGWRALGGERR